MATATETFAALRRKRFNLADYLLEEVIDLYNAAPPMLAPQLHPDDYGLKGYEEVAIEWAKGKKMYLWERIVNPQRPTYVLFHGINGHWGGCMAENAAGDPVTTMHRIKWLKAFAPDVNIIAVSMPGFGDSHGPPSRPNFDAANKAVFRHLTQERHLPHYAMVAAGESMGANHAFNFAAHAYEQGKPVAQVTAVTPFKSMALAAADVSDLGKWVTLNGKRVLAQFLFGLSNHDHKNDTEIERLKGSGTRIVLVSAGMDNVCRPWHQRVLAAKATEMGLEVAMQPHDGAGHKEWVPSAVTAASKIMLEASSNAEAVQRIWDLGMAAGVPSLPSETPLQFRGIKDRMEDKAQGR